MDIKITLAAEEAIGLVNLIGQLPTSSNAHPLFVKLHMQVQAQLSKNEVPTE